ncbi:tol-pal system protein YbgF [Bradyrhizobium sp. BWA-3-5]|uniref:tol-pal system protein YbgF n=1 Tax=Bradyrhizobium sp. BWA-3-5 TaxID=3080013 RepID=UPI00293F66B1|nr:tol-pal system protein YbgF [Bradyrhizobium sp. BWA-3-5]WOH65588.1 tol-pal system protein YbgF [Bradyrhizobium sp. BWA-3-5]
MSSRFLNAAGAAAVAAMLALSVQPASAQITFPWERERAPQGYPQGQPQSDDADAEMRIQRLEQQLRQLTGQNEELQYRNRQLEERLRQLGAAPPGPGQPQAAAQPGMAAAPPPVQPGPAAEPQQGYPQQPGYRQPSQGYPQAQPGYDRQPQIASPAPIVQEPAAGGRRRGDAFDPNQNPNAPGAPRALGGGQMPVSSDAAAGAPGGRGPGEPLNIGGPRDSAGALPPPAAAASSPRGPGPGASAALTTLPPSATPKDEFDLGIGYMQRKDYALAEETMKNFAQKYPNDALLGDAQYWLGESYFQRQQYRDAAEAFLGVTSKYDKSGKAPDALLRLGQSLAALKEKEAACAALGEVGRKYPRASAGVKAAVDREQKRVKC